MKEFIILRMKIIWISILLLLLASQILFAQKQGLHRIDSLLTQLQGTTIDSNLIVLNNDLSLSYHLINPDKGIVYGLRAFELAQKINSPYGMTVAMEYIGVNHYNKSDYSKALEYFDGAMLLARKIKNEKSIAKITAYYGIIYSEQSNYSKALEYDLSALEKNDSVSDKTGKATILLNIGNIHLIQKDYIKANDYFTKALKLYQETNNQEGIAKIWNDMGHYYYLKNNFDKSFSYFSQSLAINEELGYIRNMATNLTGMAICYGDLKNDYMQALFYLNRALPLSETIGYKRVIIWILGNIGEYYYKVAKDNSEMIYPDSLKNKISTSEKAASYLNRAIDLANKNGELNSLQYFYVILSEVQAFSGKYKNALESFKTHSYYSDSIFSFENNRKINELEAKKNIRAQAKRN